MASTDCNQEGIKHAQRWGLRNCLIPEFCVTALDLKLVKMIKYDVQKLNNTGLPYC